MSDLNKKFDSLDTEDVASKRLEMHSIFTLALGERLSDDFDEPVDALKELKDVDGYMYKLSQDFLLSSSTMEKETKLGKILEHLKRKNE